MTKNSIRNALNSLTKRSAKRSIFVNTWHIADEQSVGNMLLGKADRKLGLDFGDFFSYSENNPLVSTVYKSDVVARLYSEANMQIIYFAPGNWRGDSENGITSQDLVVSILT